MKKNLTLFLTILSLFLVLTGCAGSGDWKYSELPGNYELIRTSAKCINLAKTDDDSDVLSTNIIEGYITQFMVSGDYILITNEKEDDTYYYLVNTADDTVLEFTSENELRDAADECGISDDFEWTKTSEIEHDYSK